MKLTREIVGIPCTLILIADELPVHMLNDTDVILFRPIKGIHTAFQAQCIWLLYPCIISNAEGVIISDIDMIPLNKAYFVESIQDVSNTSFFS